MTKERLKEKGSVEVPPLPEAATTVDVPITGLPVGTYQVSYAVTLSAVDDTTCMVRRGPAGASYTALSYGAEFGAVAYRTHHAAALLVVEATDDLSLRCQSSAPVNFAAAASDRSSVTFLRVDTVTGLGPD